jgi:hypothetical protein
MKKVIGNSYGNTYAPMDAGAKFCGYEPPYAGRGGNNTDEWTPAGGGGGTGPVTIFEVPRKDTEDARMEYVTECNACSYYNRGECGRTGLESHPDDFCSRAVPAEA